MTTNVNKFTQEVLSLRNKAIDCQGKVEYLTQIREKFFADINQYQQLLNQASDRHLRILINMIYNVTTYVIAKRNGNQV